jgi:transaldolase
MGVNRVSTLKDVVTSIEQFYTALETLKGNIDGDDAGLDSTAGAAQNLWVSNPKMSPSTMTRADMVEYVRFAKEVLRIVPEFPVSFNAFRRDVVSSIENEVIALDALKIKIYSDGADLDSIAAAVEKGVASGFTTNPTLMARAGVTDYLNFAKEVLRIVPEMPVSFEVFSDEIDGMREQAMLLGSLGSNVYVKIPVTNTKGESTAPLIKELSAKGFKLNVTAILTLGQCEEVVDALAEDTPAIVSIFAGRIADSGRDPIPLMQRALEIMVAKPLAELLWASPREALNIVQAEKIGCHIITVTPDLLAKAKNFGKSLEQFSLETVKMFYDDAQKSGLSLKR